MGVHLKTGVALDALLEKQKILIKGTKCRQILS